MQVIQINSVSGTSPYDVYVCDSTVTYCYLVGSEISVFPYSVDLPNQLYGVQSVFIKLTDANGCEIFYSVGCLLPTPSVTVTPSYTPTPTPTPTRELYPCRCIIFDNTASGTLTNYSYVNCNGIQIYDAVSSGELSQPLCGSNPVSYDPIMTYTIGGNCINNVCPPGI